MARVHDVPFIKGHGTQNDFIILPDFDGVLELTPQRVQWLCDRRGGIGADGVLRVVRTENHPEFADYANIAEFFMDHRNADGSIAEMCGNGARVFVRFLDATGAITSDTTVIATRAGLIEATLVKGGSPSGEDDEVAIGMGMATTDHVPVPIEVTHGSNTWQATAVHVPNPHAVVFVDALDEVGNLIVAPTYSPREAFPDGVNIEFAERLADDHMRMRVHERGVGETQSCGTGACAVAWAFASNEPTRAIDSYRVDVPGGTLTVHIASDGRLTLQGPAVLVARGTFHWPRGL